MAQRPGAAIGESAADSTLADRYPGDVGIEKDPAVIFAEGFEGEALPQVAYEKPGGFYDLKAYPELMHATDKEAEDDAVLPEDGFRNDDGEQRIPLVENGFDALEHSPHDVALAYSSSFLTSSM